MRVMATILAVCCMALPAMATMTATYGWEDGTSTVLGKYGEMDTYNVTAPDPVHGGAYSLKLVDQSTGDTTPLPGTPECFVAWVSGLTAGDTVTASIWRYDTTGSAAPSCRIWGAYGTPAARTGSAGGNNTNEGYGTVSGWDKLSYTWTISGTNTDLLVVVRTYSLDGDTVWVDDLTVEAPDTAKIVTVPEPATLALLAIGGLVALRRRRA